MTGGDPSPDGALPVERFGDSGPPVVLLHELNGLTPATRELACFIADAGYRVHVPRLFGPAGGTGMVVGTVRLCVSREFAVFRSNRSSPIVERLQALCSDLADDTGARVGVIGMCATGGIVLSLLWDDSVGAVVASQPALPLRLWRARARNDNLGASAEHVESSAASGKPIRVFAFEGDAMCPAGRVAGYGEHVPQAEITTFPKERWNDHAVLTVHTDHAPGAREALLGFLAEHLASPAF